MDLKNKFQINDKMMKYQSYILSELQHEYLELPGEFESLYSQEVIFPNMEGGRADDIHSSTTGQLINLEEESDIVDEETLQKNSKYARYMLYKYTDNIFLGILCHKNPENFPKSYRPSDGIEYHYNYFYFPEEELLQKHENIINKVEQKEELSRKEALEIAFIPKYIGYEKGPKVTKSLASHFKSAIINDNKLKENISVLLSASITKYITDENEYEKLMEMINMKPNKNAIRYAIQDELAQKDLEISKKDSEISEKDSEISEKNLKINKMERELHEIISDKTLSKKDILDKLIILL